MKRLIVVCLILAACTAQSVGDTEDMLKTADVFVDPANSWIGTPINRVTDKKGPPDLLVPGALAQERNEHKKTYGDDKYLKGTPYEVFAGSYMFTQFNAKHPDNIDVLDTYEYKQPHINESDMQLRCNILIGVNEGGIIKVVAASHCSDECKASNIFNQWMTGKIDPLCVR